MLSMTEADRLTKCLSGIVVSSVLLPGITNEQRECLMYRHLSSAHSISPAT